MKNCILILSAILLAHDKGGSFVSVQARSSSWTLVTTSPTRFHHRCGPSLATSASTESTESAAFSLTRANDVGQLQYKRNSYVSIISTLRLRGGGESDGAGDNDNPHRRRRRRRKKPEAKNSMDDEGPMNPSKDDQQVGGDEPVVEDAATAEPAADEDADARPEKRGKRKRRRSRLSGMFGRGANDLNDGIDDDDSVSLPLPAEKGSLAASSLLNNNSDFDKTVKSYGVEGEANTQSLPAEDDLGADKAQKKKRKRRVRKELQQKDSSVDKNSSMDTIDSVSETQGAISGEDVSDTAASRIKKKRKKRRSEQKDTGTELFIDEAATATGDDLGIEPVDSQSDVQGESLAKDSELSDDKPKKKRKRKRRSNVSDSDEAAQMPLSISDASVSSTESPLTEGAMEHQQDLSRSITVDTSIEIPNEEIVPESIGASVEMEDNIPMLNEVLDAEADESTASGEGSASSITEKKKKRRKRRKQLDDETAVSDGDDGEAAPTQTEMTSTDIDPTSTTTAENLIQIDTSVEIPNEEIVPESIGASIELEENVMPVDQIQPEDEDAHGFTFKTEVLVATDQEKLEGLFTLQESVDEVQLEGNVTCPDIKDQEVAYDLSEHVSKEASIPAPVEEGNEIPLHNYEMDNQKDRVDSESSESVEKEEEKELYHIDNAEADAAEILQPTLSIDASIELPSEEIVPESVDATVEIEESLNDVESIDVETLQADAASFDVTISSIDDGIDETVGTAETSKPDEQSETIYVSDETEGKEDGDESNVQALMEDVSSAPKDDNPINVDDIQDLIADDHTEDNTQDSMVEDGNVEAPEDVANEDVNDENDIITKEDGYESDKPSVEPQAPASMDEDSVDDATCAPKGSGSIDTSTSLQQRYNIIRNEVEELVDEIDNEKMEEDCLTLSVVTWNLAEAAPSEKEASFFQRFRKNSAAGTGSDLVMIGAQECEEIKPRRTEGHRSRHIRRMGIMMLGKEYVPLAIHSLGGIQCALYCHRDVLGDVEMINIADVTCGVGNVLHNKGAIGLYLKMKHTTSEGLAKSSRMLFVSGHLAAHVKNVDARNSDFKRIISELEAQAPTRFLRPRINPDGTPAECDGTHLLSSMDHVFFAGDLNYRIDLPREYVERCIDDIQHSTTNASKMEGTNNEAGNLMKKLLRKDQLLQTIASGRAFSDFNEGKITFLPTFKFDKGTSNYDTSHKQRVPAWTDRILFRSHKVRVLEYQSVAEARHSDHRPVFGTYQLGWGRMEAKKSRKPKRTRSRQRKD